MWWLGQSLNHHIYGSLLRQGAFSSPCQYRRPASARDTEPHAWCTSRRLRTSCPRSQERNRSSLGDERRSCRSFDPPTRSYAIWRRTGRHRLSGRMDRRASTRTPRSPLRGFLGVTLRKERGGRAGGLSRGLLARRCSARFAEVPVGRSDMGWGMSFPGPKRRRHLHRTSRKDTGTVCGAPHTCPGAQRQRSARGCRWESSSRLGPRDAVLGICQGDGT